MIASQRLQILPVTVLRIDGDHRIVRGTATKRSSSRIKDAVLLGNKLRILLLHRLVAIVTHKEIPAHRRVFTREGMKTRNAVVISAVIAAGFKNQHRITG